MEKNETKRRAGKAGARARWGEQRVVRLDDLTPAQRRLVLALVEAAKEDSRDVVRTFRGGPLDGDTLPVRNSTDIVSVPVPEQGQMVEYREGPDGVWVVTGTRPMPIGPQQFHP